MYTFGELLDLPSIKEVGCPAYSSDTQLANDPNHEKTYRLLQLFAYGTLKDYAAGALRRESCD